MKTLGLTEEDLKEFYSKVVTYGVEILNNIDKMEALQLREYAIKILQTELYSLEEIVIKLPDFDYPVEYKNGNELRYWKDKSSTYSITKPIVDYLNILINVLHSPDIRLLALSWMTLLIIIDGCLYIK